MAQQTPPEISPERCIRGKTPRRSIIVSSNAS
jgi:hypothetical protein